MQNRQLLLWLPGLRCVPVNLLQNAIAAGSTDLTVAGI